MAVDLFLLYDKADAPWAEGYLRPALESSDIRIRTEDELRPGSSRIDEFTQSLTSSTVIVLVLSPAFISNRWSSFGRQLSSLLGVEDPGRTIIPALLHRCEIPLDLRSRKRVDFTEETRWDSQAERLRAEISQTPAGPAVEEIACPYPGLLAYTERQSGFFFGRHREIRELRRRLPLVRLLLVVGPSGSGKSSLVFAGLLPELRERQPREWLLRSMRPGADPIGSLAAVLGLPPDRPAGDPAGAVRALLDDAAPGSRLLLVVDQFEEALAQASAPDRKEFLAVVRALRDTADCVPVLTMRADFYPDLMQSELWPVADDERLEVVPLRGAALREAIEEPARRSGVFMEPALAERLIADAAEEPGALPLLQETLRQLWWERRRRLLTTGAYEALGRDGASGLAVALATWADTSVAELPPDQQAVARRVFLRLVHLGDGRDDTRRQQTVAALRTTAEHPALLDRTLARLTDRRLVTRDGREGADDAVVDLAHEALIACWPRLRRWLTAGRQDELFRRAVQHDADEWQRAGRDRSLLYRGRRLRSAREWRAQHPAEAGPAIADFLAAGRRLDASVKFLAGVLVALLGLGLFQLVRIVQPVVREAQLRRAADSMSPHVAIPAGPAVLGEHGTTGPRGEIRRTLPAFGIDRHEVSNAQYRLCVQAKRCSPPIEPGDAAGYQNGNPDLPVVYVTALQAAEFCRWLGHRLPTTAEWERAARGSGGRAWPWGQAEPTRIRANIIFDESEPRPAAVNDGRFAAGTTPEGIAGLVGNVWEWTSTPAACEATPYDCRTPWNGIDRIDALEVRGLSFRSPVAPITTAVAQEVQQPTDEVGFRCARTP